MDRTDFGPVYGCPRCDRMVQYVNRHGQNVLEDVAEGGRHHCQHEKGEPLPRYVHCACGVHCIDRHGQRYDLAGQLHRHDAPKVIVTLRPVPAGKAGKLEDDTLSIDSAEGGAQGGTKNLNRKIEGFFIIGVRSYVLRYEENHEENYGVPPRDAVIWDCFPRPYVGIAMTPKRS